MTVEPVKPVKPQEAPRNKKAEDLSVEKVVMNKKQRILLFVAVGLIVLTGLFPPFKLEIEGNSISLGYEFLFGKGLIDFEKLLIEWVLIAVVTGALWVVLKKND